jgi:hypothetical protein
MAGGISSNRGPAALAPTRPGEATGCYNAIGPVPQLRGNFNGLPRSGKKRTDRPGRALALPEDTAVRVEAVVRAPGDSEKPKALAGNFVTLLASYRICPRTLSLRDAQEVNE